jgi:hypothetical protein
MAVVVIQEFEATPEEYDQVNEKLGEETPEGAILHAACDLPGDIRPTTGVNRIDPLPRHKEEKKWQFSWSWSFR